MVLSTKLMMRQGQSLVMTPQLLQAIKLLQFSSLELAAFVQEELERNPLLERVDEGRADDVAPAASSDRDGDSEPTRGSDLNESTEAEWSSDAFATDRAALEQSLGTELTNSFDEDRPDRMTELRDSVGEIGLSAGAWAGTSGADGEAPNLEAYLAAQLTLKDHLLAQVPYLALDATSTLVAHALIDAIDESGYLREQPAEIAERLGVSPLRAEAVLRHVQTFDPAGVGARDLAECLAAQLRERNRYDPAMQTLVANLELVARRDLAGLRRACGVDEDDILDMIAEIKQLDPKPGRAFGASPIQPVVPDVVVRAAPDGSWHVELNTEALPRLLVNQSYATTISRTKGSDKDRSFISGCLQTANWLTKSLEQRARTILKVASEIVRQQDAFFAFGVEHLRPLNLKTIADATGMHESTVSRVTSNKYLASPRGLFELKYFFTASIASNSGGESHSAESVRFRIKQMIDRESAGAILSDDSIVARLKEANIDIARRTVAKYREGMRIPSSVERRRLKAAQ